MVQTKIAGPADLDRVIPLFDQYRVFFGQSSDPDRARDFLAARMAAGESVIILALENGRALGFTQLFPLFSSVSLRRTWLLNDLFVDPAARKKGVGAALLEAARLYGLESGARWLMLETAADNKTAQSVYEKSGWKKMDGFFYQYLLTG